mgnify:CR=1 FL=1
MKLILLVAALFLSTNLSGQDKLNILIITGGHNFDREAFFDMFNDFENISFQEAEQPKGNIMIENEEVDQFDLLLFYDMYDSITPSQKDAYLQLLKDGKPMIFLHHALVSYQDWPEFIQIIGGKYNSSDSTSGISVYEHDVNIPVKIVDRSHPITAGLSDFEIYDETYGNCVILDSVHPLISTDLAESMPYLAWINEYEKSKVVYIQSGHGPSAYSNLSYRKLLEQAIEWLVQNH